LLALNILAVNMSDRGARIMPCVARYPSEHSTPLGQNVAVPYPLKSSVTLERAEVERMLGVDMGADELTRALREYGCGVAAESDRLTVTTPPYRLDYLHPVDAIEDYAISVGYGAFVPQMPTGFTVGTLDPLTQVEDRVRDRLIGYGFEEVMTNVLTNRAAETERVARPATGLVEIDNVMSEGYSVLRGSLVPSLLRVEAASATSLYPHRVFEVGECAVADPAQPEGSRTLSAVAALIAHATASFSELQSYLDRLCYDIGLAYKLVPAEKGPFIAGRQASILVGETPVGDIGEVHPETLTLWGLRTPLVVLEMDLTRILELRNLSTRRQKYGDVSTAAPGRAELVEARRAHPSTSSG
jgi:phenylalanyl-tRNA synthetase beta chain